MGGVHSSDRRSRRGDPSAGMVRSGRLRGDLWGRFVRSAGSSRASVTRAGGPSTSRWCWTRRGGWVPGLRCTPTRSSSIPRLPPLWQRRCLASIAFVVSLAYAAIKVVLGAVAAVAFTSRRHPGDRVLVFVALVLSLPFLHDVFLGNGNVILVAAMALAAFGPNRARIRHPAGDRRSHLRQAVPAPVRALALGEAPRGHSREPWRRALRATLIGVLVAGVATYADWVTALVAGGRFAAPFAGNHGISALWPTAWVPVAAVTALAFLVVLYRARPAVSLVWAADRGDPPRAVCGHLLGAAHRPGDAGRRRAVTVVRHRDRRRLAAGDHPPAAVLRRGDHAGRAGPGSSVEGLTAAGVTRNACVEGSRDRSAGPASPPSSDDS